MRLLDVLRILNEAKAKKEKEPQADLLSDEEAVDIIIKTIDAAVKESSASVSPQEGVEEDAEDPYHAEVGDSLISDIFISKSSKRKPIISAKVFVTCKPNERSKFTELINLYTSSENKDKKLPVTKSDIQNSRQDKLTNFEYKGNLIKLELKAGKIKTPDTHELMTAALCLSPTIDTKYIESHNSDKGLRSKKLTRILSYIKRLAATKNIIGKNEKDFDALSVYNEDNLKNIAKAVSAADAIKKAFGKKIDTVYLTGKKWDDAVAPFRITKYSMQDFNSSDIICASKDKKFLGVSLKKKNMGKQDPTLINLALNTAFEFKKETQQELDKVIDTFYVNLIKKNWAKIPAVAKQQFGNKIDANNWKKYVSLIKNEADTALKAKNGLFDTIKNILQKNAPELANILTELVFKCSLKELKQKDFDFALCTGRGDYLKRTGLKVGEAEYESIDTVSSVISDLSKNGKPTLLFDEGSIQANANFAGLKFYLAIGNFPICEIALRYKGNFTSSPSFTGTMTERFKSLLLNHSPEA